MHNKIFRVYPPAEVGDPPCPAAAALTMLRMTAAAENVRMMAARARSSIPWSLGPGHTPTAAPPPAHTQRRTTFLLILYSNYSTTTYAQHSGITGTIFSVNVNSLDLLL